jgi:hypothetical protein
MKSQRKSDEYVFDDWASLHGRLLPWSEDQTTTHYESAQLRYLQRQPSSNEPSYWTLDETPELIDDEEDGDPFARERGRARAWLAGAAAGSGLIAAVLFGRVLLYGAVAAQAAAPEPSPPHSVAPPPSVDIPAPQSASEVSPPAMPLHSNTTHSHARTATVAHLEHEHEHVSHAELAPGSVRINSRPWSQVFIDERLIGNTPQLDISLPAGSHTVRLTNPEFGMSKVFSLQVRAGETVTRVETLDE